MQAVRKLEADGVTHLIVASCTGFTAPGLDFQIMRAAGLPDSTQRTIVGFMGCFAAVNALKLADQIVRADPAARVLTVNLELSSLHLQEDFQDVPKMLSFLLFADGAAAALVTADPTGIALGRFQATVIPAQPRPDHLAYRRHRVRDAPFRPGSRPYPPLAAGARPRPSAAGAAKALGRPCRRPLDPRRCAAGASISPRTRFAIPARFCATSATCPPPR